MSAAAWTRKRRRPNQRNVHVKGKAVDATATADFVSRRRTKPVKRFERGAAHGIHIAAVLPCCFRVLLRESQRIRPSGRVVSLIADAAAGASLWGQDISRFIHDNSAARCQMLDDELLRAISFAGSSPASISAACSGLYRSGPGVESP